MSLIVLRWLCLLTGCSNPPATLLTVCLFFSKGWRASTVNKFLFFSPLPAGVSVTGTVTSAAGRRERTVPVRTTQKLTVSLKMVCSAGSYRWGGLCCVCLFVSLSGCYTSWSLCWSIFIGELSFVAFFMCWFLRVQLQIYSFTGWPFCLGHG